MRLKDLKRTTTNLTINLEETYFIFLFYLVRLVVVNTVLGKHVFY